MSKKILGLFILVALAVGFLLNYPQEKAKLPPPIFVEVTKEKALKPHRKMLDLANGRPTIKEESLKIDNKDNPCRDLVFASPDRNQEIWWRSLRYGDRLWG